MKRYNATTTSGAVRGLEISTNHAIDAWVGAVVDFGLNRQRYTVTQAVTAWVDDHVTKRTIERALKQLVSRVSPGQTKGELLSAYVYLRSAEINTTAADRLSAALGHAVVAP